MEVSARVAFRSLAIAFGRVCSAARGSAAVAPLVVVSHPHVAAAAEAMQPLTPC